MTYPRMLSAGVAAMIALAGLVALPSPAAAAMNVQRVEAVSAYNGDDIKTATAYCPAGTKVIGGGADVGSGALKVHITGSHPVEASNAWVAVAKEHSPHDGPWNVAAHAVCAFTWPLDWHIAYLQVGGDSAGARSDTVFCDAGEKVLGFGARVVAPDTSKLFLTVVAPTGTGNGTQAAAVEMTGGYSGNWYLRMWAVCAVPPSGWENIVGTEGTNIYYAVASCTSPKKLTGAGAYISPSLGLLFLQEVAAIGYTGGDPDVPDTTTAAAGWVGGTPYHEWRVKTFGICVS